MIKKGETDRRFQKEELMEKILLPYGYKDDMFAVP